jgi:solute:Na+ symporter, SSS family
MGTFFSFLFFTTLVAVITFWRTRRENLQSSQGYFLGGNSLNGWVIAGSLLLTNLSAANITGMTAQVYGGNLAPIAWTVTVIPPLLFFAGVLLPTFLKRGFATVPEFLEQRYGSSTRRLVTCLFLFCYIFGGMPVALYGGAIAIMNLFDVPTLLGMDETQCVWLLVGLLGIIGGIYALFGGLKGVAVSDTLNGVGLLTGGVLVFVFGVIAVGQGSFFSGAKTIFTTETHKLDAIGSSTDLVPFAVLFTGMVMHNAFYWCTNQFIVQRCFGARNLAEGQKGVIIAGYFKIINVFYIAIPGVIAYHLYGADQFANNDWAYPTLVRDIMPGLFVGFFAAVIFGAVLSTYNSVLNSSVTLLAIDIYKPIWGRHLADDVIIRRSKWVGSILVVVTLFIAPLIMNFSGGIFLYMVKAEVLFGAPIFLTLLIGYFSKTVSTKAANITLVSYLVSMSITQFASGIPLHFLHVLAILFVVHVALVFGLSRVFPLDRPITPTTPDSAIDMTPWPHFKLVGGLSLALMVATYVIFSPWGLVKDAAEKNINFIAIAGGLIIATGVFLVPLRIYRRDHRSK